MISIKNGVGLRGEFSVEVRKPNGELRCSAPLQSNLVLDNAIKYLMRSDMTSITGSTIAGCGTNTYAGVNLFSRLWLGTGNTEPEKGQYHLTAPLPKNKFGATGRWGYSQSRLSPEIEVLGGNSVDNTFPRAYVRIGSSLKFEMATAPSSQNVTELGIVTDAGGNYNDDTKIVLVTRALIRDSSGTPTAITIVQGDSVLITYNVYAYVSVTPYVGEFTLTDDKEGNTPIKYSYLCLPSVSRSVSCHELYPLTNPYYTDSYGVKEDDAALNTYRTQQQHGTTSHYWQSPAVTDHITLGAHMTKQDVEAWAYGLSTALLNSATNSMHTYTRVDEDNPLSSINQVNVATGASMAGVSADITTGIKTHIHTNGIRILSPSISNIGGHIDGTSSSYRLLYTNIIVSRADGSTKEWQGIKKTDMQKLSFSYTSYAYRWEGDGGEASSAYPPNVDKDDPYDGNAV